MAQKQTHIDQWKQAREPINKSTLNGQLIYDKGSKNIN